MQGSESIKETVALDFKYGNKKRDEKKIKVNTYELGGGRVLSNMLQAPLSATNISNIASICIVLDMSKPGNVIDSLLYWLQAVREYTNKALNELQQTKPDLFQSIHHRSAEYWGKI